jgi:general secretion pathway protein E
MGVEDYLLASSLLGVLAQRLVRKVCPRCRVEVPHGEALLGAGDMTRAAAERFATVAVNGAVSGAPIYRAAGCEECSGTGYRGRSGIYELLLMNESIRELILKHASADGIKAAAVANGMRTLRDDGWLKVREGTTTVAEVVRVTQDE